MEHQPAECGRDQERQAGRAAGALDPRGGLGLEVLRLQRLDLADGAAVVLEHVEAADQVVAVAVEGTVALDLVGLERPRVTVGHRVVADLGHAHPVAEGDGEGVGQRVGGGVGEAGEVDDAHALGVPGDGHQLLARVDPQHVGGADRAVLDGEDRREPGADLGGSGLEVAGDVVEVQPAAGALDRGRGAGALVGDDEDGALDAVGVLHGDRVGLVRDVDRGVDDLADDLGVGGVGGVHDQRLRERRGVGAGAVGAEGDVVGLRAQRRRDERDLEVLDEARLGGRADVVDRDERRDAGRQQVGVGVVEVLPARVDRHVVRPRPHRQEADALGLPGLGEVDDHGAGVTGGQVQVAAAARGGAGFPDGAVGGVAGQHATASGPHLDVALGDRAVVDGDAVGLARLGDVDDLEALAQGAGQGVLLLAQPHELDVRAVLRLAGVVVLQVGDELHRHPLPLGLHLDAAGVGRQVAGLVGGDGGSRQHGGDGGEAEGEQGPQGGVSGARHGWSFAQGVGVAGSTAHPRPGLRHRPAYQRPRAESAASAVVTGTAATSPMVATRLRTISWATIWSVRTFPSPSLLATMRMSSGSDEPA